MKPVFTPEELPSDQVMLIVKNKEGVELACILPDDAPDDRVVKVFRDISAARRAA